MTAAHYLSAIGNTDLRSWSARCARHYRTQGWTVLPVAPYSDHPRVRWSDPAAIAICGAADLEMTYPADMGIAVLLGRPSGMLVDVDLDHDLAVELAPQILPPTCSISGRASRPGSHRWYVVDQPDPMYWTQHRIPAIDGQGEMIVELRGDGRIGLLPPSWHRTREQICWAPGSTLPPPRVSGLQLSSAVHCLAQEVVNRVMPYDQQRRIQDYHMASAAERARLHAIIEPQPRRQNAAALIANAVRRARAYVAAMPPAIEGHGGDAQTYTVALVLLHGFALPVPEALQLIREYNTRCLPPWEDSALAHKIDCAERYDGGQRGYLLDQHRRTSLILPATASLAEQAEIIRVNRQRKPKRNP